MNNEEILSLLRMVQANEGSGVIDIDEYDEFPGQRVAVSSHVADHIGYYHTHNFYEINYVVSGSGINLVEEDTIVLHKGDFLVMHPGTFHTLYALPESNIKNFLLRSEWFEEHFCGYNFPVSPMSEFIRVTQSERYYRYILFKGNLSGVHDSIMNILDVNNLEGVIKYPLLEAHMMEFICSVMAEENGALLSETRGNNTDVSRALIRCISDNYRSISLHKLAELAGYSKTHICRIFKNDIGKSFVEVLTDVRLGHACHLLINTDDAVRDIAYVTGYESVEYFQRLFKRKKGITPGEYRSKFGNK